MEEVLLETEDQGLENSTLVTENKASFQPHFATVFLFSSMLCTGASGLVNEYILATVSTYILGNSIEQFSVIIALMMLMMGFGGALQKIVPDSQLLDAFILLEIILAIGGGFAPLVIYSSFAYFDNHFFLILYGVVMGIGLLIGFEVPLLIRINQQYTQELSSNLAIILAADFIGSFLGAILWTYVLLKVFPLTEISFLVAGLNFLVAIATYTYFRRFGLTSRHRFWLVSIFGTLCLLSFGFSYNRPWNLHLEQKLYDDPIIFRQTTKYQHLVMTHDKLLNDYRLYINGNTQFSSLDEHQYHELLVHPALSLIKAPEEILILGGGDGLALREVLKYPSIQSVTLVDLDEAMTDIASHHPIFQQLNQQAFKDARVQASTLPINSGEKKDIWMETGYFDQKKQPKLMKVAEVNVYHIDAAKYIRQATKKYDAIIIDFPDPNSVELAKLYSREFYKGLQRRLKTNGLIVLQATSPYHAREAFLCIGRTLNSAQFETIPYHQNIPSFGDWGWYLAWSKQSSLSFKNPTISLNVPTKFLTPEVFQSSLVFGKNMLLTKEKKVNTLMFPSLMHYYLDAGWLID